MKKYSDICQFYNLLDCYIVSSRFEGGPRSILESMSSGVPIYSTKVGQAKELIVNGVNGWLYNINDLDKLADLIHLNFKNKKLLSRVVKRARATALNNDHKKHLSLWIKFFIQLNNDQ